MPMTKTANSKTTFDTTAKPNTPIFCMNKNQLSLTLVLFVMLILVFVFAKRHQTVAPPTAQMPAETPEAIAPVNIDVAALTKRLKEKITPQNKSVIDAIEKQITETTDPRQKAELYRKLSTEWEKAKYVEIAALYQRKIAEYDSTQVNWQKAAEQLDIATAISSDSTLRSMLLSQTVTAYERLSAFQPNNTDVQVKLAGAYIDAAGNNPAGVMKGVLLLREIVHRDTTNVPANLLLGKMAIISGQTDKAINRLEYVTKLDSNNPEAYYYLANAYLSQGNKEKAIESLKKCKSLVKNATFAREIDNMLKSL